MINRRRFLQGCAASAAMPLIGARIDASDLAAGASDYRALVCVFLLGGNDSWNMFAPAADSEYSAYAWSRQNLAVPKESLIQVAPEADDTATYGFHPVMPELAELFMGGKCAVVANVGALTHPIAKADYRTNGVNQPPRLFSHEEQQIQWFTLRGRRTAMTGWAGRTADVLQQRIGSQPLPTNMSLQGQSIYQSGVATESYVLGAAGVVPFAGLGSTGAGAARRAAFQRLLDADYGSVYARGFATVQKRALRYAESISTALASAPPLATTFSPTSSLARQLQTVAQLISVRAELGMSRQVFYVGVGGYDTHASQSVLQPALFADLSASLAAFYRALVELGVASNVVTFTESEFGRTLRSNGDGTDHGWGGLQFVLGDAVLGRRIYGRYPPIVVGGEDDIGGGRLIPTTSTDQYAATLARWLGIPDGDLPAIAPSLPNFAQWDLGFLA